MTEDPEQQYRRLRLKKSLEDLRVMKGMGTELVSVLIPPDKKIHDVRQQLSQGPDRLRISNPSPQRNMYRTRSNLLLPP